MYECPASSVGQQILLFGKCQKAVPKEKEKAYSIQYEHKDENLYLQPGVVTPNLIHIYALEFSLGLLMRIKSAAIKRIPTKR